MPDEKHPLTVRPGGSLSLVGSQGGRIVTEMVSGALKVSRAVEACGAPLIPRFRVGDLDLCEPDYRQILVWAELRRTDPYTVLIDVADHMESNLPKMGRLKYVCWDFARWPVPEVPIVPGLSIQTFVAVNDSAPEPFKLKHLFTTPMNDLRSLYSYWIDLEELDLSLVPKLTCLDIRGRIHRPFDLVSVPDLENLWLKYATLETSQLSSVPKLQTLNLIQNSLTSLSLPSLPRLTMLHCHDSQITELDLSSVPLLSDLACLRADLAELDIRSLLHLKTLCYDADKTRLIQRPDQNF